MNGWGGRFGMVVDCLNHKQYYREMINRRPSEGKEYGVKIKRLQNKLVQKL